MSTKKHDVPEALLTSLLADYKKPEDLIGENGLLKQLTKLLVRPLPLTLGPTPIPVSTPHMEEHQ